MPQTRFSFAFALALVLAVFCFAAWRTLHEPALSIGVVLALTLAYLLWRDRPRPTRTTPPPTRPGVPTDSPAAQ